MFTIPGHKGNTNQKHVKIPPIKMAHFKNTTNVGKDVRKKEPSYTAGRNIN
jgi:hypothetical protein